MALFPYMLAALDDAVIDDKKGAFPFWVALNLVDNYFFFAGQAVFLIIYFCIPPGGGMSWACASSCAWRGETALGCACGCVLLLLAGCRCCKIRVPSTRSAGTGICSTAKPSSTARFFTAPCSCPTRPISRTCFREGILKHTSLTAYLPLVGVAGGLAFCRARERHPFTYVLKVCVACAFVPVLNSAFYALNSSYYARWYYMPILVLCGATCYLLSPGAGRAASAAGAAADDLPDADGGGVRRCAGQGRRRQHGLWRAGRARAVLGYLRHDDAGYRDFALLWHFAAVSGGGGAILTAAVLGFSLLYGSLHLSLTKYAQWDVDSNLIAETYDSVEDVAAALPDDAFYRIDAYGVQ